METLQSQYLKNSLFDPKTISLLEQSIEHTLRHRTRAGFIVQMNNLTGKTFYGESGAEISTKVASVRGLHHKIIDEKMEHPLEQELLLCLTESLDSQYQQDPYEDIKDLAYLHSRFIQQIRDICNYIHGRDVWWIGDILSSDLATEQLEGFPRVRSAVATKISPVYARVCLVDEVGGALVQLNQFQGKIPLPISLDTKILNALHQGKKFQKENLLFKKGQFNPLLSGQDLDSIFQQFSGKILFKSTEIELDFSITWQHILNGKYRQAIEDYEGLLKKISTHHPSLPSVYHNRGFCFMNINKYDSAFDDLHRAIELEKNFPNPFALLGDLYRETGDNTPAVDNYQHCLELLGHLPYNRIDAADCNAGIRAEKGLERMKIAVSNKYRCIAKERFSQKEMYGLIGALLPEFVPP